MWLSSVPKFIETENVANKERFCVHPSVKQHNSTTTQEYKSTTVQYYNSTTMQQYNTTVQQHNSKRTQRYNITTVQQCNSTSTQQYINTSVQQYNNTTVQRYNSTTAHYNSTPVEQHDSPQARLPPAPLINCSPNMEQREFSELFILSKTIPHYNTNLRTDPPPVYRRLKFYLRALWNCLCYWQRDNSLCSSFDMNRGVYSYE